MPGVALPRIADLQKFNNPYSYDISSFFCLKEKDLLLMDMVTNRSRYILLNDICAIEQFFAFIAYECLKSLKGSTPQTTTFVQCNIDRPIRAH